MTKKHFKLCIDIAMTLCFILLMGNHIVSGINHEIIGTLSFVLFIVHNIINYRWYKNIFKGKYTTYRFFHLIINICLCIMMILTMISSIMISASVFAFFHIPTTMIGRNMHMMSTSWTFVFMALHIALHTRVMIKKVNQYFSKTALDYVNYLFQGLLVIYGIYAFIKQNLLSDMLLWSSFKLYDYNQWPLLFYFELMIMIIAICLIVYYALKIIFKK